MMGSLQNFVGHSADAVGNKVYIFGGLDSTQTHCLNDLHVFDIGTFLDLTFSNPLLQIIIFLFN
jgi:hypothetical protein